MLYHKMHSECIYTSKCIGNNDSIFKTTNVEKLKNDLRLRA